MEAQAETLVRYLLKERCRQLRDSRDILVLEAALSLCHQFGFQDECEIFTNRILDGGTRKVKDTNDLASPLVMSLSGFFDLPKNQFDRQSIPRKIRDLISPVRQWHSQQLEPLIIPPQSLHGFTEKLFYRSHLIHPSEFPEIQGDGFTIDFVKLGLFRTPILIHNPIRTGFKIVSDFGVSRILDDIGGEFPVKIVDVMTQQERDLTRLGDFISYFCPPSEERMETLNLISLNISGTQKGAELFQAPNTIRALDWAVQFRIPKSQRVTHYILLSPATSFTDFHFDLSGSSAWLYLHTGEKVFYFVEPSEKNLELYQRWQNANGRGRVFFPSLVNGCRAMKITAGQLLLVPGGWIHGVSTPIDSIAVGGNFLHNYNIPMQIVCHTFELEADSPREFLYPNFDELHSKVFESYQRKLQANEILTELEIVDIRALSSFLKK
jgi:hypothetical protein